MQLEIHVVSIERDRDWVIIKGEASLWADDLRIYQVNDLSIGLTDVNPG